MSNVRSFISRSNPFRLDGPRVFRRPEFTPRPSCTVQENLAKTQFAQKVNGAPRTNSVAFWEFTRGLDRCDHSANFDLLATGLPSKIPAACVDRLPSETRGPGWQEQSTDDLIGFTEWQRLINSECSSRGGGPRWQTMGLAPFSTIGLRPSSPIPDRRSRGGKDEPSVALKETAPPMPGLLRLERAVCGAPPESAPRFNGTHPKQALAIQTREDAD